MAGCAVILAILGVFETGTKQYRYSERLPPEVSDCISRVKDTTTVLSLTGIAITVAAFVQAIQAVDFDESKYQAGNRENPNPNLKDKFTLFHAYMTLAILAVISIVGSWSLIHCQLLRMSIKRGSSQFTVWWSRFAAMHMNWTFGWWCHHIQLLTMGAFGVYVTFKSNQFKPLPKCNPGFICSEAFQNAAKTLYIILLLPILNNILFCLPSFLLAVAGAHIYLVRNDERPWSLFHAPDVDARTVYRVILGIWGVGMIVFAIPLVVIIEAIFGNNIKNTSWDFDSVYAVALVIVPLQAVIKSIFRIISPGDPQSRRNILCFSKRARRQGV